MDFRLLSNVVHAVSSLSGKAGTYLQLERLWDWTDADGMFNFFSNAHDSNISITHL